MGLVEKEEDDTSRWKKFKKLFTRESSGKSGEETLTWNYLPLERTRRGWHGEMDNYKIDIQIKRDWTHRSYKLVMKDRIELQNKGHDEGTLTRKMFFDKDSNLRRVEVNLHHDHRTYKLLKRDIKKENERMDKGQWRKNTLGWRWETQNVNKKDEFYVDSKMETQTKDYFPPFYKRGEAYDITCTVWETQKEFGDRKTLKSIEFQVEDLQSRKILDPSTTWFANIQIVELENNAASFIRQDAVARVIDKERFKQARLP